jgi:ectoine hydroxylase-related dioxygenase (phytanoyl-CoA dioxygenase family)
VGYTGGMAPVLDASSLTFRDHGAQAFPAAAHMLPALVESLGGVPQERAGVRLGGAEALCPFLAPDAAIGAVAAQFLGADARAVRAILFDKTAQTNWSLAWHQDRTICVRRRVETPGFGPWTIKGGMRHVAPPFAILAGMVTLRVHIDPVGPDNAPLLIAPGSHREGLVRVDAIGEVARRCGTFACLADAGDVWAYATPIVHASEAAMLPARRRVLQIDFAAQDLPGELEWLGV